jgi:F0F1-type ATP synthase membrane subunit a
MQVSPLTSTVLFHLGSVTITRPVVTTWVITLVLTAVCWLVTRRLRALPEGRQAVLEIVVTGIAAQIEDVIRKDSRPFLPLLGTLFIFLVTANLSGLLPGVEAPTRGMSEVLCKRFPLGVVSFFAFLLQRAAEGKRSPNWMANCPMAAVHSMGLRQCTPAFLMAR